jgi:hypothetical protein
LSVWLTGALRGCEEAGVKGVLKEGVAQAALIHHKESVGEADASEVVGICVDPAWFVKEGEEVTVPLRRERSEFPHGCVWCVQVPNTGEEVVEDGDEGGTAVLEKAGSEAGLAGGFIFGRGLRGPGGSRERGNVYGESGNGEGGVGGTVVGVTGLRLSW